ncbi:hypothetical protein BJ944DRAFT_231286 [Cunninghamella echinulata]|nr:hypothetical protein BJ944DRAFT_231286 [Cunninghamella echinulata]
MPATKSTITKKTHSMKNKTNIPRPINCFMAFRLDKYREISSRSPTLNHRDISKVIAKWWREATEQEKEPYRKIAATAKLEHEKLYPNYKYAPKRKSERQTRPYHRKQDLLTRKRKEAENKKLLKPWLQEDVTDDDDVKKEKIEYKQDIKVKVEYKGDFNDYDDVDDDTMTTTTTLSNIDTTKLSPSSTTVSTPSSSSIMEMYQINYFNTNPSMMITKNNSFISFTLPLYPSTPTTMMTIEDIFMISDNDNNNNNTFIPASSSSSSSSSYSCYSSQLSLVPDLDFDMNHNVFCQLDSHTWPITGDDLFLPMEPLEYINPGYLTYC